MALAGMQPLLQCVLTSIRGEMMGKIDQVTAVDVVQTIRFERAEKGDAGAAHTSRDWYTSPNGAFRTGFWSSERGKWDIHYKKDELCLLLEGVVRLTDSSGHVEIYSAGDTFVIPTGFQGSWETVEPVRKFFAVHRPQA